MSEEFQSPSVSSSVRLDDILGDSTREGAEKAPDDLQPLKPGAGDAPVVPPVVPTAPPVPAPRTFESAESNDVAGGTSQDDLPPPLPARSRPEPDSTSQTGAATELAKTRPESVDESFFSPSVAPEYVMQSAVVDLIYWRDIKKTGLVFGASLFLLLSMTIFSIVSVIAYLGLAVLSVTISFRIYRGILQAVQKSDDGHPFKTYLEKDVAVSDELVHKYSDIGLGHINHVITELRRLFLVQDLVDSLKFTVLMWLLTYVGALFNGLTLLIIALVAVFSIPVVYERHQAQIDHYIGIVSKQIKDVTAKIQAKVPGLKKKTE
ncbi:reticulon-1-A-like isoform X6 [Pristis pectinata]|uniref:reticulon-1-A-like isoform X6 n=1 Tax=Pristis pectinata TaxID=685728 RepID=UPI00223E6E69|nr:reticulon-1-A-like isoform X6 [Pristis pectinata]